VAGLELIRSSRLPSSLIVIDLTNAYSFCHAHSLTAARRPGPGPERPVTSQDGERCLMRHY
jgi:hypothetical protein